MTAALLEFDRDEFREAFDRRSFAIRHQLSEHSALSLECLCELAARWPQHRVEYNRGDVPVSIDYEATPGNGLSVEDTIRNIESNRSWMVLKHVQEDPEIGTLLKRCLTEVGDVLPETSRDMTHRIAFVFVSSPGAVTPFHIDPENNFLLQARGQKTIYTFAPDDRIVLSERQIERFTAGGHRNLELDKAWNERATPFVLRPGDGVHVPMHAPHYVCNGDNVSISLSITFQTPNSDRRRATYWANHQLRRLGLRPKPPGRGGIGEACKHVSFAAARSVARLLRSS